MNRTIKVAEYCRVSTDMEDQLHSLSAQIKYFTEYISNHEDYELTEVYYDDERTQWYISNSVIISRSYRQICNKHRAFEYTLRLHLRGREPRFCRSVCAA